MTGQRAVALTVLAALGALSTACLPGGGPMQPPEAVPAVGPELVLEVVNRSNVPAVAGYEFEAVASSGGGEGEVPACHRVMLVFGTVGGDYEILVDRDVTAEGRVPAGVPPEGFLVLRIVIDEGGVATAGEPRWTRVPPDVPSQPLGDCA
ncbi:MAG TPA: hypothetical protein VM253_05720 [Candidatus Limnocylindrales bacterium]|jgi:hypothetical protein|nr:hypothetical protein [Candidatus Limnocylindrales bacterium]